MFGFFLCVQKQLVSQGGVDEWRLLLGAELHLAGVALVLRGNLLIDHGQDGQEVSVLPLPGQHLGQALDVPGSLGGVAPGVKPRDCGVADQKVGMGRDLSTIFLYL